MVFKRKISMTKAELIQRPYLRPSQICQLMGVGRSKLWEIRKEWPVQKGPWGYKTTDVIKMLGLEEWYAEMLKKSLEEEEEYDA